MTDVSGAYTYVPLERGRWGQPAAMAVAEEVARVGAQRALIVASDTLARTTEVIARCCQSNGFLSPVGAGMPDRT